MNYLEKNNINLSKKGGGLEFDKLNSNDTAGVFKHLIDAKKEYQIVKEQETTKRMQINSQMKIHIENITAKREFFKEVLKEEYGLRKETIDNLFLCIDRAFDEDKNEIVISALEAIEGIVKENPLKALAKIASSFENDDEDLII